MEPKNENNYFLGSHPILESEPINIPNVKQCRINHGLSPIITKNLSYKKTNRGNERTVFININK